MPIQSEVAEHKPIPWESPIEVVFERDIPDTAQEKPTAPFEAAGAAVHVPWQTPEKQK